MDPYLSAKQGDLAAVQQWAEANPSSLNQEDEHLRTVLYYSALCGHENIVKYLLSIGAEVKPFDAVSALTDHIRIMLEKNDPNLPEKIGRSTIADTSVLHEEARTEYSSLHREGF